MRKPDLSLIGKTYNNLKVVGLTEERNSYNRRLYRCTCLLCGKSRMATKQNLENNEIKDCGNHRAYNDITDQRFTRLVAKYPLEERSGTKNRCKVWHCICDCLNECDVPYNDLVNGNTQSCGCLKKETLPKLFVEKVNIPKLLDPKLRSTNTSGVTGVCWNDERKKWEAEIRFQGTRYRLGRYNDFNDAVAIRKEAETALYGNFLEWYNEYKNRKGDKTLTNDNFLTGLTGKKKRDYLLQRMYSTYEEAERLVDEDTPLYYKYADKFINHPAKTLSQYETDLTERYVQAHKSRDYADKIGELISLLGDNDYTDDPITEPESVLAKYLKWTGVSKSSH